jgi:hypothetical protein
MASQWRITVLDHFSQMEQGGPVWSLVLGEFLAN